MNETAIKPPSGGFFVYNSIGNLIPVFNKAILEIDKVLETFPEPQRSYYSSMLAGLYFAAILMIPAFLFLLGVMIIYHESVFTIQNLLRLVLAIIVLDAMRNSGSK